MEKAEDMREEDEADVYWWAEAGELDVGDPRGWEKVYPTGCVATSVLL